MKRIYSIIGAGLLILSMSAYALQSNGEMTSAEQANAECCQKKTIRLVQELSVVATPAKVASVASLSMSQVIPSPCSTTTKT